MKSLFIFILSWGLYAKAVDVYDDPNLEKCKNPGNVTEGSFNDMTKGHQSAQQYFGQQDTAYCPNCAKQNALFEIADDGVLTDRTGAPVQDDSSDSSNNQ